MLIINIKQAHYIRVNYITYATNIIYNVCNMICESLFVLFKEQF